MNNIGNIFVQTLNQVLQRANYSREVSTIQNQSIVMGNNPDFFTKKLYHEAWNSAVKADNSVADGDKKVMF